MKQASLPSPLRLAAIGVLALVSGCYRYVPVEMSSVQPGSEVRARLTAAGEEEMRRLFGPGVRHLDGDLVRWNDDGIAVLKKMTLQVEGFPATEVMDTLRLTADQFSGVELKEVDGRRTAYMGLGVVAGMATTLIAANAFGGGEDNPGEGGGGDTDELFVLFSIPFQIFR